MKYLKSILFLSLLTLSLFGQKQASITTALVVEKDIDVGLSGVTAKLFETGKEIASTVTNADGVVSFKLEINSDYLIELSKQGYVSKIVNINTKMPDYEKQQFEIALSVLLFVPCEGLDYSVLQNPVVKIVYDEVRRDFFNEKNYSNTMNAKLQQLMESNDKCVEEKYQAIVKKADRLFAEKKYPESKDVYIQARDVRPDDKYVKKQLEEIERLLAEKKDSEKAYKDYIAQADKQFADKRYPLAKEFYKRALIVKPGAEYPTSQIAIIDKLLAQQSKEEQDKQQKDAQYEQLISQGNESFGSDVCGKALSAYREALALKPNDPVALQKIASAEQRCKEIQSKAASDKDKQQKYRAAIAKADSLYKLPKYNDAITAYQNAMTILPTEKYPQSQIDLINDILKKQNKDLEAKYKALIKDADKQFDNEDFTNAKNNYQQASDLKPNEIYPKDKIKAINDILAEMQRAEADKKAKRDQFNKIVADADAAFKSTDYTRASTLYQQALQLISSEPYPKQKLDEIERILQSQADKLERDYNAKIQSGDKNFVAKSYQQSLQDYKDALQMKPNEVYPSQRIDEINKLLADQAKKAAESKAKQDAYDAAIKKADQLFSTKKYDDAVVSYREASSYLPSQQYPFTKIEEINQIKKQLELDANYKKAITNGDSYFTQKQYQQCKSFYNQALGFRPNDKYAIDQIAKADKELADEFKRFADAKARQDAYDKAIAEGDKNYTAKEYEMAKSAYQTAMAIFADKPYPKQKIEDIDKLLKDIELNNKYKAILDEANTYFGTKTYIQAKSKYQEALALKPAELFPKEKISEIDKILAQQELDKQKQLQNEKNYNDAITKADGLFDKAQYDAAQKEYERALTFLPDEAYPKQKIAKIKEIKGLLAKEAKQAAAPAKPVQKSVAQLGVLNFSSNNERELYLKDLLAKYPPGITCEVYKEKNKELTRYIIIRENQATEFRSIKYNWGTEYFRNDKSVTLLYFNSQVKPREGEYYSKTDM